MQQAKNTPVILMAFANDRANDEEYLRDLPQEHRILRSVLQPAVDAGLCEVVDIANATLDDILKVFQSPRYRNRIAVLHYGGHANGYQLLLESEAGSVAAIEASGLARFLAVQNSLRLVFLNGCSTQQQSDGLLAAGVDAVISTSVAINDSVATKLSSRFYRALAGGADITSSFKEACAAAQTESGGSTRAFYAKRKKQSDIIADRFPWSIYFRDGAESVATWNLPEAANDPLFGLPDPPQQDLGQSPFRHLSWFRKEHAELFFGRGKQIRDLYSKVTGNGTAPIVLYYGQSGVGKSSLLEAGLIPRLETSQVVHYLRRDHELGLAGTLKSAIQSSEQTLPMRQSWLELESQSQKPMTIILDQVEEAYTRPNGSVSEELRTFLDDIHDVFYDRTKRPHGRLILAFRKEWLAELKRKLGEYKLPYTEVFLERLDRQGVIEAVSGPAKTERLREHFRLSVEQGLPEQIADDLLDDAGSAVAPTLQILLSRMWEAAIKINPQRPAFTRDLYSSMRREGVLLRDFLEKQIDWVQSHNHEVMSPDLLLDLLSLHTTSLGTAEQCSIEDLAKHYQHHDKSLPQILSGCRDAYLLTGGTTQSAKSRLAHDTLAPLVRQKFEMSDHPGQRARRILENRVVEWENGLVGTTLDAQDLSIVEEGKLGMRAWTADEQRMVAASRTRRRRRNVAMRLIQLCGILLVAAITGTAIFAAKKARDAEKQERLAKEQFHLAENRLASSLIVPMRHDSPQITDAEIQALWKLTTSKSEHIRQEVFRQGVLNPNLGERMIIRMPLLAKSAIGLSPSRRESAIDFVESVLDDFSQSETPKVYPDHWKTTAQLAALATALRPIPDNLARRITEQLVQRMQQNQSPWVLGMLVQQLEPYGDQLTPDEVKIAIRSLRDVDVDRSNMGMPDRLKRGFPALAPYIAEEDVANVMDDAIEDWKHPKFIGARSELDEMLNILAERLPETDAADVALVFFDLPERFPKNDDVKSLMNAWATVAEKSPDAAHLVIEMVMDHWATYGNVYYSLADSRSLFLAAAKSLPENEARRAIQSQIDKAHESSRAKLASLANKLIDSRDGTPALAMAREFSWDNSLIPLKNRIEEFGRDKLKLELLKLIEIHQPPPEPSRPTYESAIVSVARLLRAISDDELDSDLVEATSILAGKLIATTRWEHCRDYARALAAIGNPIPKDRIDPVLEKLDKFIRQVPESQIDLFPVIARFSDIVSDDALVPFVSFAASRYATVNDSYFQSQLDALVQMKSLRLPPKTMQIVSSRARWLCEHFAVKRSSPESSIVIVPDHLPNMTVLDARACQRLLLKSFAAESNHIRVAKTAALLESLPVPLSDKQIHEITQKLYLWLHYLPPATQSASHTGTFQQTNVSAELANALKSFENRISNEDRILAAHAMMHAMLQDDYRDSTPLVLDAFEQMIQPMENQRIADLYLAPWCVGAAQSITLAKMYGKPVEDQSPWQIAGEDESQLSRLASFDKNFSYPADVYFTETRPTFSPETSESSVQDRNVSKEPSSVSKLSGTSRRAVADPPLYESPSAPSPDVEPASALPIPTPLRDETTPKTTEIQAPKTSSNDSVRLFAD